MSEERPEDAEQLRVGVRKGMMPWGRERLAEAVHEAGQGDGQAEPEPQKALWHLNCATNLNPKFGEAIELKSRNPGSWT